MSQTTLIGTQLTDCDLSATNGETVNLANLRGIAVIYVYPRTSPPKAPAIEGWDQIPGARGCTPQSCGFRDHYKDLRAAGATHVFGLSTQDSTYQKEVAGRLHLPFPLLSDSNLAFSGALGLKTFEAGGMVLLNRKTLIARDGIVVHTMSAEVPACNAAEVLDWLRSA